MFECIEPHDGFCNCEACIEARDGREVCTCCGGWLSDSGECEWLTAEEAKLTAEGDDDE